jgi:hypothetical protein
VPRTGSFSSRRAVADPRSVRSSLSPSCAVASALYDGGAVTDSTREGVGDDVVLTRNVPDVCRELRHEVQVVELRGEHLSRLCWKASVRGLWSGNSVRRRPPSVPPVMVLTLEIRVLAAWAGKDRDVTPSSSLLFRQSTRRPKWGRNH